MPKLSKAVAKKVEAAESKDFEPIEPGVYHVRLRSVEVSENPGPSGSHYWKWEFEVVEPGTTGRLWTNTSLSENAAFKLNEAFAAFGETADTDTEDLLGEICKAVVSVQTIQGGARKGQQGNQVDKLLPADDDFEVAEVDEDDLDV